MSVFGVFYLALIIALLVADFRFANWSDMSSLLSDPRVRFSIWLSLISCTIAAILSLWVAIPTGFLLARLGSESMTQRLGQQSPGSRRLFNWVRYSIDTLLDIPIVLPPLVVGISLLVLFQTPAGRWLDERTGELFASLGYAGIRGITYEIPAVILAQFTVAAAFAIRTMRNTFEQIDDRPRAGCLDLGCESLSSVLDGRATAGLARYRRCIHAGLGPFTWEFGPILIFAGTARMKTEVLSTTVYLNFQFGNLRGAVSASLILVTLAIVVLILTRLLTLGGNSKNGVIV